MNKRRPKICVVGSINMDMNTTTDKVPAQGETVLGNHFSTSPGGKGANQAVAAARLGADVAMIGMLGDDALGNALRAHFKNEHVEQASITTVEGMSTGVATIILSDQDNRIIVAPGANSALTPQIVEQYKQYILDSDVVLLQYEIPVETIEYTVQLAAEHHIPVIINPAPYTDISEAALRKTTFITPNEIECIPFTKMASYEQLKEKLIITKGSDGVEFTNESGEKEVIPAYPVSVVDTTGAGDTFNGALATEWARTNDMHQAILFANAASALSIQKEGAQGGMPTREQVEQFIEERNT